MQSLDDLPYLIAAWRAARRAAAAPEYWPFRARRAAAYRLVIRRRIQQCRTTPTSI